MFEIFIRRPILSGVISVVIVFLGLLAINSLPITQFPDIVPPSVTVTARYTGANADVMAKTVATPLERAINGVPGMTYMTSVCTNDGMSLTTIYFKVGTDPDVASVNVQNRVTTVLDELPEEVIRAGVITEKEVNSMLMYLNIMSSDSTHTEKFVYNFADINILRELKRIDGVGFVEIMGSRDYAMRVWLNPNRVGRLIICRRKRLRRRSARRISRRRRVRRVSAPTRSRSNCNTSCSIAVSSARRRNMARSS